jgi:hypothetical protein
MIDRMAKKVGADIKLEKDGYVCDFYRFVPAELQAFYEAAKAQGVDEFKASLGEAKCISVFDRDGNHVYTLAITDEIPYDIAWDFAQEHINEAVMDRVQGSAKWKAIPLYALKDEVK